MRGSVVTLLLDKLRTERRFLEMPYYTWWFEYGALEIFEPVNGLLPRSLWSDWEQFVANASPELLAAIGEHDSAVEGLRDACEALQKHLEVSPELRLLYEKYTSPQVLAELETEVKGLFGARPSNCHLAYLAQLIVNGTPPDCSPLYTIRPLWLRFGSEFLALREHPAFQADIHHLTNAAHQLENALQRLDEFCANQVDHSHEAIQ